MLPSVTIRGMYGIQFHPEVVHTPQGKEILKNFAYNICGCKGNWTIGNFITENIASIRETVGKGKVISALSGGVDSAVVATFTAQGNRKSINLYFCEQRTFTA